MSAPPTPLGGANDLSATLLEWLPTIGAVGAGTLITLLLLLPIVGMVLAGYKLGRRIDRDLSIEFFNTALPMFSPLAWLLATFWHVRGMTTFDAWQALFCFVFGFFEMVALAAVGVVGCYWAQGVSPYGGNSVTSDDKDK